jgi:hypothetical protein
MGKICFLNFSTKFPLDTDREVHYIQIVIGPRVNQLITVLIP